MSQENVEIVQGAQAEFERGNFWIPEIFDPSVRVVWLPVAGGVDETVGLDGMARAMKEWMQSWEQVTSVAERVIDAGDQVVIIAEWRGRGKASGVLTKWRYGSVWTLSDGKVTEILSYTDPAAALEAVGLSEQDAHAFSGDTARARSQDNVEIVRRSVELWSDGNWEALGAVCDPHLVILPPDGWPDGEVRLGLDAWIEQSMILKEPWETDRVSAGEAYEAGDSVVVRLDWIGTGRGSGIAVDSGFWAAYTLVAGKIIRIAFFADRPRALAAIGLSEQDAHADS